MVANLTLGRYELLEILGDGGFATVYRAWDPSLGREVALKALHPHLAAQPGVRRRFVAEAQALARLTHPHIVTVYDVGSEGERPFFTMELLRGPTLAQALPGQGGLSWEQTLTILTGLASAVDYLHAAGLIHRDIKAANVILTGIRPVLMDFGIVRAMDEVHHTRTGAALGTPEAMAPEQVRGEEASPATDIYQLGILAYLLLSGALPFAGETARVLYQHVHEPPPPLEEQRPGLPAHVYTAVATALAKDPAQRPHSAADFVRMLRGSAVETTAKLPGAEEPPAPRRRRGRLAALLLGAVLLGMSGMAGAALLLDDSGSVTTGAASATAPASATAGPGTATATATEAPSASPSPTPATTVTIVATPSPTPPPPPAATALPGVQLLLRPGEVRTVNIVHDGSVPARYLPGCASASGPADITLRLRITRLESPAAGKLWVTYEVEALTVPGLTCRVPYEADAGVVRLLTVSGGGVREWSVVRASGIALQEQQVDIYGRREFGAWEFELDLAAEEAWIVQPLRNPEQHVVGELHRVRLLP